MITSIRAAIAIVMLLGFYVLAFAVVGGLGWVTVWMFQAGHSVAGKLAVLTVGVAAGILIALWKVIRAKPEPPAGLPLPPAQAPELWATVTELAAGEKTRKPDQILMVPEVNAAVSEESKLLGLVGGRRTLYLGAPLVQAFSVAQLPPHVVATSSVAWPP